MCKTHGVKEAWVSPLWVGSCIWELRRSVASTLLVAGNTHTACTCLTEKEFAHYSGSSGSSGLQV